MTEGVINCVNGEGLRDKLILKNGANYLILQIKSEYNAYSVTECTETTITLKGGTYSMFTAFGIE